MMVGRKLATMDFPYTAARPFIRYVGPFFPSLQLTRVPVSACLCTSNGQLGCSSHGPPPYRRTFFYFVDRDASWVINAGAVLVFKSTGFPHQSSRVKSSFFIPSFAFTGQPRLRALHAGIDGALLASRGRGWQLACDASGEFRPGSFRSRSARCPCTARGLRFRRCPAREGAAQND